MKTAIITSKKDNAAMNIAEGLKEFDLESVNAKVYEIEERGTIAENLHETIEADQFIFASRHVAKEKTPSLTCHVIGNWNLAEHGGKDKTLNKVSAIMFKKLFQELSKRKDETDYQITMEATHHGPFVDKPTCFIEIGSDEKEWEDKEAGKIIAKTIFNFLQNSNNENSNYKIAIGIGGPHYCNNFNKIQLGENFAISHICPKYMLPLLTETVLQDAIDKTKEKVNLILLDWKGLGKEKQRILELLENINIEYKRIDQIKK